MESAAEIQIDNYVRTALNIIQYFDGDAQTDYLNQLTEIVKNNCVLVEKWRQAKMITENIIQDHSQKDEAETDIADEFARYKAEIDALNPNPSKLPKFVEFSKQMQLICQNEKKEESGHGEDEDMTVSQFDVNVIDPFSKTRMKEPVKNVCGHVYDKESVCAVVKLNNRTRCPMPGCKSKDFIDLNKLTMDVVTLAYLKKNPA